MFISCHFLIYLKKFSYHLSDETLKKILIKFIVEAILKKISSIEDKLK